MKRKVFDVVKLVDGNMATILEVYKDTYKIEKVNNKGESQGIIEISENDIDEIIISK